MTQITFDNIHVAGIGEYKNITGVVNPFSVTVTAATSSGNGNVKGIVRYSDDGLNWLDGNNI